MKSKPGATKSRPGRNKNQADRNKIQISVWPLAEVFQVLTPILGPNLFAFRLLALLARPTRQPCQKTYSTPFCFPEAIVAANCPKASCGWCAGFRRPGPRPCAMLGVRTDRSCERGPSPAYRVPRSACVCRAVGNVAGWRRSTMRRLRHANKRLPFDRFRRVPCLPQTAERRSHAAQRRGEGPGGFQGSRRRHAR